MEAIKLMLESRRDNSATKAGKMERSSNATPEADTQAELKPVTLDDLPVEVLDVVVENLTLTDLSQLRLVSKAMLKPWS